PGTVHGIDVAPSLVERATAHAVEQQVTNVTFATADGYDIDAPDDSYDLAHAHQVLQHVSQPHRLFAEMLRVVKPGGLIAARDAVYSSISWYPDLAELSRWQSTYIAAARYSGGDPD